MRINDNEEIMDYVNLFVSVLICFPEVGKIRYDRDHEKLYFSFLLKDISTLKADEIEAKMTKIKTAVAKYHQLSKTKNYEFDVITHLVRDYDYLVIDACRDIASVTRAEMAFLIELFRLEFIDNIMVEKMDSIFTDDYNWYYEEGELHRLNDKKMTIDEKSIGNQIVICREAGKVLVFSN